MALAGQDRGARGTGHLDRGVVSVEQAVDAEIEPPAADHRIGQTKISDRQVAVETRPGESTARLGVAAAEIAERSQPFGTEKGRGVNLAEDLLAIEGVEEDPLQLLAKAGKRIGRAAEQHLAGADFW
jgi:hypothetical protein